MVAWMPIVAGAVAIGSSLLNKKKVKKRSTLDKNQKKLWGDYEQGLYGKGPLADLYSFDAGKARDNFMSNYAQPAYEKFQQEVVPTVTGQFRSKNLQNSTYAGQALAREGRNVQTDINRNMSDYMYKQEQNVMDRRSKGINDYLNVKTFDYEKPQENFLDGAINGAVGGIGKGAGKYFSNQLFGA